MASKWQIVRIILHVFASLALLAAIGLMTAALFTHSWQEATIPQISFQQQHYGLYELCVSGGNRVVFGSTGKTCAYFDFKTRDDDLTGFAQFLSAPSNFFAGPGAEPQPQSSGMYPKGERWRMVTLILVVCAIGLGLFAFCFSLCSICAACTAILWAVFNAFSSLCALAAVSLFRRYAEDIQEKFQTGITQSYEKRLGLSYKLASIATACFFLAGALAIAVAVVIFLKLRSLRQQVGDASKVYSTKSTVARTVNTRV